MIVATSATVRNLTSLSGVASAAMLSPLPAMLRAPSRIRRTSHVRLQRKSCAEKGNPGEHPILVTSSVRAPNRSAAHHGRRRSGRRRGMTVFMAIPERPIRAVEMALSPPIRPAGNPLPPRLTSAKLAAAVAGGLNRGQECGAHRVFLQLADGIDRGAAWRGYRLAQDHRVLAGVPQHRRRAVYRLRHHFQRIG